MPDTINQAWEDYVPDLEVLEHFAETQASCRRSMNRNPKNCDYRGFEGINDIESGVGTRYSVKPRSRFSALRKLRLCTACEKPTLNRHFCSISCSNTNRHLRQNRECALCGKMTHNKYCSRFCYVNSNRPFNASSVVDNPAAILNEWPAFNQAVEDKKRQLYKSGLCCQCAKPHDRKHLGVLRRYCSQDCCLANQRETTVRYSASRKVRILLTSA